MLKKRNTSLDILRAFAILLVLGRHMPPYPYNNIFIKTLLDAYGRGGWIGVDLFFVLSGFLISGLLFAEHKKTGSISFKRFFIRRGLKIYPAFYVMIAATLMLTALTPHALLTELFFMQDYAAGLWNHTWSLGVEEKFYLLLPLLFILLSKINKFKKAPFNVIPVIFIFVSVSCLGLRLFHAHFSPYQHLTHLFPFHLRVDALFWGVTISYFYHYHSIPFKIFTQCYKLLLLILGFIFLLPAFLFTLETTPFIYTGGLTLFYLGSGFILMAFIDDKTSPNVLNKILAYIGAHSYSIYLWHMPVERGLPYLFHYLPSNYCTYTNVVLTFLIGSIGLGILMSKLIEFPILKMRDRFFPNR